MTLPYAISLPADSGRRNRTGTWRVERPVYVDRVPPCTTSCPAGEEVQAWLYAAEEGNYEEAWRRLTNVNPFPAIMGRICYHPCETACNRASLDNAVGINAVERFLGDYGLEHELAFTMPETVHDISVLVIGAGPSGLTAAYHLRRRGFHVVLCEREAKLGGMLEYGIPAYRLPRDIVHGEVERLLVDGIDVHVNMDVDDLSRLLNTQKYAACYVAIGEGIGKKIDIPAEDGTHLTDALSMLRKTSRGEPIHIGKRVAVYGGGNTAMDAARTARRLGAHETVIVYRRTVHEMPAHPEELAEALEEGVEVQWLSTISHVDLHDLTIEQMVLDDAGRPQPTGRFSKLDADTVILAVGQDSDTTLVSTIDNIQVEGGEIVVDEQGMTGAQGVFAGGDVVPGMKTVTDAIGMGKRAATAIAAFLGHADPAVPNREAATYERLNTWYFSDAPRSVRPTLETARRTTTFDEVVLPLDAKTALFEARRCMSCGNCFQCDNCYGMCPDNAIIKDPSSGHGYKIDLEYCKGCGICAEECPCGAIDMIPEPF